MVTTDFAHLHVHTEGSFLDGLGSVKQYVKRAQQVGQSFLAQTDHGNLCNAPEFYKESRKAGIEPIIGCEFYFVPDFSTVQEDKDRERSHITVLARGYAGYQVLSALNTATWGQYYYKPLLDRKLLEDLGDDTKHLTVLSGCAGSRLSQSLLAEDEDAAREELLWWRETFPHYYLEMMHHGTDFDVRLNERLHALGMKYNIPWVVTNDPHYAVEEDAPFHDCLLAIQTASDLDDPRRFRFDGEGYWLKSRQEMYRTFKRAGYDPMIFKAGAYNALEVARQSHTRIPTWESRSWQIPKFPDTDNAFKLLKKLCYDGLRRIGRRDDPAYLEPMKDELRVIKSVGIEDFLLITMDVIDAAKRLGIPVGPGRGSVCGSLVGYLIGIHKVDPIKYKLLFERFLNPARPKMPDIDTDFGRARRGEVFEYAVNKYGEENTMNVAAFGRMQVKAAFNSIGKAFGIGYQEAQALNKEILEEYDEETGFHAFMLPPSIQEQHPEMAAILNRLAGVRRSISAHPAGLIIADPSVNLHSQVPLMYIPSSKRWVGAFDKKAIEGMGFMKQDFLGLRALDTIQEAVRLIKERRGIDIDPDAWNPDDEPDDDKVYAMCAAGRTAGVFQMEGPANQRGCRDVKPTCFEDLVSITSLYRTGAISAGFPKIFNENRKKGKRRIQYLHPALKPLLEDTWGVVLYQEQVMEFGRTLAGFDMVQVDEIKEAIKDKSSDEMERLKEPFITGCRTHSDIPEDIAEEIWGMIEGYAGYGYNRSHAVAYTLITYQTARLKALYPIEYFSALLRTVKADKANESKRDTYLREAIEQGAKILPPDINVSGLGATPDPEIEAIRFGLMDYKGIGEKQAIKIIDARPADGYATVDDVAAAVRNVGIMKVLKDGSALESLGVQGIEEETERLLNWQFRDPMVPYRKRFRNDIITPDDLPDEEDEVSLIGMIYKVDFGRTKNDKPFVTWKIRWSVTEAWDIRLWSETERHWSLDVGSVVQVVGKWENRWLNVSVGNPRNIRVIKRVDQRRVSA